MQVSNALACERRCQCRPLRFEEHINGIRDGRDGAARRHRAKTPHQ